MTRSTQTTATSTTTSTTDDGRAVTAQQWKWSVLAGMASYLDAGSIVAIGASLTLWQHEFGLSTTFVGALAAIGPNAIGCAVGSAIGGRLGDLFGRKRVYQYDLLVYLVGVLLIAFALNPAMLVVGTVVVGLAVGTDVPTSSALIGEFAPDRARGKLLGFSAVAWNSGPVVVLLLALATSPLGLWSARIVFLMLFAVCLLTYVLRRGMVESAVWVEAVRERPAGATGEVRRLFAGPMLRGLLWTGAIYLFWNLAAGTSGLFTPYIVQTLHAGSQQAGVALSCASFVIGILVSVFVFMPLADRSHRARQLLWTVGFGLQFLAYLVYLVLPFTIPVVLINVVAYAVGAAMAGDAMYKVFSQELFPTRVRGTAQGLTFGVARLGLGVWSFFVPQLATLGIRPVAGLLLLFIGVAAVVGIAWMPDTAGKPLAEFEPVPAG